MKTNINKSAKRAVSLLLAMALTVPLCTSCKNEKSDTDAEGRTTLSVGAWPTKSGSTLDTYNERKADFEKENKDVVIVPDTWAFDLKTFYPKAEAGMLPNVFLTHFTEMPQILGADYSADITDVLSQRGYDGKFSSKITDLVSKDGKMYAFPYEAYVLGLAYNTELFEAAGLMNSDGTPQQPKTWDELAEFAVKIKEATGKPGFIFPTSGNQGGWIFNCVAWSFGVDFMEQDSNGKWIANLNSDECVEALEFIKSLKWKYDVLPSNTLIDWDEEFKTFSTGGAAMMITAGDVTNYVVSYDMKPDQLGMMGLPAGPKRHVTLMGGNVYALANNVTEKQKDAAIRWLEKCGYGYSLTEDSKKSIENSIQLSAEKNQLVGVKSMSVWNDNSEVLKYKNEMIDKYCNVNPNHVKLYNDFVLDDSIEIQAEEPVCAQDLYGTLDNCIQEVLNNPNADCRELLEKANSDFQTNYLDNIDY